MHTGIDFVAIAEGSPTEELELKCVDQNLIDPPNYRLIPLKRALRKKNGVKRALEDDISERSTGLKRSNSCSVDLKLVEDELPHKRPRTEIKQVKPTKLKKSGRSKREHKDFNEDRCEYCNEKGFLICCDTCPAAFHPLCHTPALTTVPEGKFVCYRCKWSAHYEKNPVRFRLSVRSGGKDIKLEDAERAHASALFLEFLRTSRVISYDVPDDLKCLGPKIPPVLPNDELERKGKKKAEVTNDCYVCKQKTTTKNANQCFFCPNAVHFDCSSSPMCAAKIYVWRCPMHVENYLDTYFLSTSSLNDRVRIWEEFAQQELNEQDVEQEFIRRLAQESLEKDEDEAASALRLLSVSSSSRKPTVSIDAKPTEYTRVEMRMLPLNSKILYNEIFRDSASVAAFFPAFPTSAPPVVYDRRRPLSFGTSAKCAFNLSQFLFKCSNMDKIQLEMSNKQGVDYLRHANSNGYTNVDGKIFLMERAQTFKDLCGCIRPDRSRIRPDQVRNHVAVFPDKMYTIQMGCAVFYLVFNPALRKLA